MANVAPVVRINTPGPGSVLKVKTSTAFQATFTDAGTKDRHTCSITWGDGTTSTGTVSESGGAGTCSAAHAYNPNGSSTITLRVTDNAGAVTTATSAISVTSSGVTIYKLIVKKKTATTASGTAAITRTAA